VLAAILPTPNPPSIYDDMMPSPWKILRGKENFIRADFDSFRHVVDSTSCWKIYCPAGTK